jgi:leucyl aminopeptidase (aminopeptidase T)
MALQNFVKSVVSTCLGIQKEDRVCVFTWSHMIDLAEAFVLECQRVGAKTHLEVETDKLYYQTVLDLPIEYLRRANPFSLSLLDVATANIFISGPEDPEGLKKITPERMSAIVEGDKPYSNKFLEKRIRSAQISLGYVTHQRAKTYGFDYEKWKKNVQLALDVDYGFMRESGKKIAKMLEKASTVHITSENGTDLTLELGNGEAHINDGVVDDEDVRRGAVFAALPAGSVAIPPKESSANGVFVSDVPEPDSGLLIHNITWKFKNGRLASFAGGKNIESLSRRWKIAGGDRDQLSWLMIGLNPEARGGYLYNNIVLGSVTVGIGDNRELGGKMESDFGAHCTNLKPNIILDKRFIIRNGKIVL